MAAQHVVHDGDEVGERLARARAGRQDIALATLSNADRVGLVPVQAKGLALPFPHKSSITVRLFVSSGQLSLAWLSEYLGYFDLTGMVCDLR